MKIDYRKIQTTKVLVETGLLIGDGVQRAIDSERFDKIYNIEFRQSSCDIGEERFEGEIEDGKVCIIHGKSEQILGDVIRDINEPITFWLDAHLGPAHLDSISETADETVDMWCPLYYELRQIARHPIKNHIIIIDDLNRLEEEHEWTQEVELDGIKSLIKEINPKYFITALTAYSSDSERYESALYAQLEPKTVVYDLDDVICFRDQTLPVESIIGPEKYEGCLPIRENIKIVNNAYDAGYKIVLYTSRGMGQFNGDVERCDKELRPITTKHLKQWEVKYHQLIFGKIHFDVFVDNKARNSEDIHSLQDIVDALGD